MAFSIKIEETPQAEVLTLAGYVDVPASKVIREKVQAALAKDRQVFLLDFSATPIVNSAALGELLEMVSLSLEDRRLRFLICGLSSTCQGSFRLVGIFTCAKEFPTRADALRSLGGGHS